MVTKVYSIGVDKTDASKKALEFTIDKLIDKSSKKSIHLALIHIQKIDGAKNVSVYPNQFSLETYDGSSQKKIKSAQEILKYFSNYCNEKNIEYTIHHELIDNRDYGSAIIRISKEVGASAIIVGTRKNHLLRRAVLGSVSSSILHKSHVPIFVVP